VISAGVVAVLVGSEVLGRRGLALVGAVLVLAGGQPAVLLGFQPAGAVEPHRWRGRRDRQGQVPDGALARG
jgi:hypothetical protein